MLRAPARRHTGGMEIFLVDDSPIIRARLIELLAAVPGAHVAGQASSAAEAIDAILDTRPDVVVLDLSLAAGTGFDVLKAVQRKAPQIDFYMLSNFSSEPYRQLASRLGARGFFDKTSEFQHVRDIITARATQEAETQHSH
jgi:DNA-binding NarL/FixJ family response regulator